MKINLQRGQFLRVADGAGSTSMRHLILAISLGAAALSGCAHFTESSAPAGATGAEEHSPYPTRYKNDNRHPA